MSTVTPTQEAATLLGRDFHVFREGDQMILFSLERSVPVRLNDPHLFTVLEAFEQQPLDASAEPWDLVAGRDWPDDVKDRVARSLAQISRFTRRSQPPIRDYSSPPAPRSQTEVFLTGITLMVAETCNLRCRYCYTGLQDGDFKARLMSEEVMRRAVDLLVTCYSWGNSTAPLKVTFFGGEPMLNFPMVKRAIAYADQRAAEIGRPVAYAMTTNGVLLDEQAILFFKQHPMELLLSIDGDAADHDANRVHPDGSGSHAQVMRAVALLHKHNFPFRIRATLMPTPGQVSDNRARLRFLESLGATDIMLSDAMETPETSELFEQAAVPSAEQNIEIFRERFDAALDAMLQGRHVSYNPVPQSFKKLCVADPGFYARQCGACASSTAVGADGTLYPCHRFWPMPNYSLGDVFNGFDMERYNRLFLRQYEQARIHCSSCWLRYVCQSGCMRHQVPEDESGAFRLPDEQNCVKFRATWEFAISRFVDVASRSPEKLQRLMVRGRPLNRADEGTPDRC